MLQAILIIMHADLKKTAPVVCKGAVTTTKTKDRKIYKHKQSSPKRKGSTGREITLKLIYFSHAVPFCDRVQSN